MVSIKSPFYLVIARVPSAQLVEPRRYFAERFMRDARESIIIINGQILRPARTRRRDLDLPFPANNKSLLIIRATSIGLIDRFGINRSVARSREFRAITSIANGRSHERSWSE